MPKIIADEIKKKVKEDFYFMYNVEKKRVNEIDAALIEKYNISQRTRISIVTVTEAVQHHATQTNPAYS